MNNNGMIVYKENFISKVKNFFKKIFMKDKKQNNYVQEEAFKEITYNNPRNQDEFLNEIKVDAQTVIKAVEKENFLRELDGNEEALNMLSMDRLIQLEEHYNSVIEQNVQKIKKLKEAV